MAARIGKSLSGLASGRGSLLLFDTPLEYPRSFVLGGKKIFRSGEGKGLGGGGEGEETGERKLKGKKK